MSNMEQSSLKEWVTQGQQKLLPTWAELPGIPLYMDQVILYLQEVLRFFETEDTGPLLTPAMVNNYVKSGVLPHPEKKKYSRTHLAALLMICMLKPVLSLKEIERLLAGREIDEALYEQLRREQEFAMCEVCAAVQQAEGSPARVTLRHAMRANAERTAAQHCLAEMKLQEEDKREERSK